MPPPGADPDRSKVSKPVAGYTTGAVDELAPDARCSGCAHFVPAGQTSINGALCKVVEGQVEANAVCERYYSDVGVFADAAPGGTVRISSILGRGGLADWSTADIDRLLAQLAVELANRTGDIEATKREQFIETVDRAERAVDELGLGPGALPDRRDDEGSE